MSTNVLKVDDHSKKCPYCAEIIALDAKKCKHCGEYLDPKERAAHNKPQVVISQSNPGIAAVMSAVIPGLGQLYQGRFLAACFVFIAFGIGCFMFVIPGAIMWLVGVLDALTYRPATHTRVFSKVGLIVVGTIIATIYGMVKLSDRMFEKHKAEMKLEQKAAPAKSKKSE